MSELKHPLASEGDFWERHNSDRTQARLSKNEVFDHTQRKFVQQACHRCGNKVNPDTAFTIHIVGGGSGILHPEDEANFTEFDADMGHWVLGPECRKHFPAEYVQPLQPVEA